MTGVLILLGVLALLYWGGEIERDEEGRIVSITWGFGNK